MKAASTKASLISKLKDIIPSLEDTRLTPPKGGKLSRERFAVFPSLKQCRLEFAKYIGGYVEWSDSDHEDYKEEDDLG